MRSGKTIRPLANFMESFLSNPKFQKFSHFLTNGSKVMKLRIYFFNFDYFNLIRNKVWNALFRTIGWKSSLGQRYFWLGVFWGWEWTISDNNLKLVKRAFPRDFLKTKIVMKKAENDMQIEQNREKIFFKAVKIEKWQELHIIGNI